MLCVKTPEDEGRQLESDPLRNPEPVEFLEQRRHVIKLGGYMHFSERLLIFKYDKTILLHKKMHAFVRL